MEDIASRNFCELKNAKICCNFTNTSVREWTKKIFPILLKYRIPPHIKSSQINSSLTDKPMLSFLSWFLLYILRHILRLDYVYSCPLQNHACSPYYKGIWKIKIPDTTKILGLCIFLACSGFIYKNEIYYLIFSSSDLAFQRNISKRRNCIPAGKEQSFKLCKAVFLLIAETKKEK